jgi:endoglucanase
MTAAHGGRWLAQLWKEAGSGRRTIVAGTIALVAAATMIAVMLLPRGAAAPEPNAEALARVAADRFLDRYMDPDGRIVRRDQGGDTVSEGQAYAMLLAVAIGDQTRFEQAWSWAKAHLQREDGLLSWRWLKGRVPDRNSASDADVDVAHALVLAARRFHEPRYLAEGQRMARSILDGETVVLLDGARVLVAGPWARSSPYVINPSYFAPSAFRTLEAATGDPRWRALVRSSNQLVGRLTDDPPSLPPDWALLDQDGALRPVPSPEGVRGKPRYGFDASRLLPRLAADCAVTSRRLAVSAGRLLPHQPGRVAAEYDLRGAALVAYGHPLADVAASAVATASGDPAAARLLLDHAEYLDRHASTYYGAAWLALGRVLLTTTLLTDCGATRDRIPWLALAGSIPLDARGAL